MNDNKDMPPVQQPNSIEGMGIHLGYIRRDVDTIIKKIDSLTSTFITTEVFEELKKEVAELKTVSKDLVEFKDTLVGKMWGVGVMAGAVVGLITILINHFWK